MVGSGSAASPQSHGTHVVGLEGYMGIGTQGKLGPLALAAALDVVCHQNAARERKHIIQNSTSTSNPEHKRLMIDRPCGYQITGYLKSYLFVCPISACHPVYG